MPMPEPVDVTLEELIERYEMPDSLWTFVIKQLKGSGFWTTELWYDGEVEWWDRYPRKTLDEARGQLIEEMRRRGIRQAKGVSV